MEENLDRVFTWISATVHHVEYAKDIQADSVGTLTVWLFSSDLFIYLMVLKKIKEMNKQIFNSQ